MNNFCIDWHRRFSGADSSAKVIESPPTVLCCLRIGALNIEVDDDKALNAQQTNFTVLRLRRALKSRASLGGIFTRRSVSTLAPGSNEVWGLDQGGGFGGGASGAVQGRGRGQWTATGAGATGALILKWSSGGQTTLNLRYDYTQQRLYVNDQRWLRGKNEYCS